MPKHKKKLKLFRKRISEGILSIFAVCLVVFPIFSLGVFGYTQLYGDPRHVIELKTIQSSQSPLLFEEGIVSVTFDDGWQSVYTDAAGVLEKYNIPSTQYILPGQFSAHNYLSLAQAKSLQKAGHEIASHTMTHPRLSDISIDQVKFELEESKKSLVKHKLVDQTVHFAAPESATNPEVDSEIEGFYASHRNTFADLSNGIDNDDINVYSNRFNRYDIIGFSVRTSTTLDEIKGAINFAKANNGWLVLVYHQIDDSKEEYSVTPQTFDAQMKLISDLQIRTATVGAVLNGKRFETD